MLGTPQSNHANDVECFKKKSSHHSDIKETHPHIHEMQIQICYKNVKIRSKTEN
jgi:hypothetical protein